MIIQSRAATVVIDDLCSEALSSMIDQTLQYSTVLDRSIWWHRVGLIHLDSNLEAKARTLPFLIQLFTIINEVLESAVGNIDTIWNILHTRTGNMFRKSTSEHTTKYRNERIWRKNVRVAIAHGFPRSNVIYWKLHV